MMQYWVQSENVPLFPVACSHFRFLTKPQCCGYTPNQPQINRLLSRLEAVRSNSPGNFDARLQANTPQSGFTLIELLIVIAIVGVLAAVLILNLLRARESAEYHAAAAEMRNMANQLIICLAEGNDFPADFGSNAAPTGCSSLQWPTRVPFGSTFDYETWDLGGGSLGWHYVLRHKQQPHWYAPKHQFVAGLPRIPQPQPNHLFPRAAKPLIRIIIMALRHS